MTRVMCLTSATTFSWFDNEADAQVDIVSFPGELENRSGNEAKVI